jgi:hypothetical protein
MPGIFRWMITLWALAPGVVMAGGLAAPFSISTTAVLPKGVRNVRLQGLSTTVDGWYNDSGISTGVAEPFNLDLSYGRLLKSESDENLKLNVESQLRNKGVTLDDFAGRSTADINTRVFVSVPTIAYGVTDRLTLALAVPIVYTNIDVETGFVGSDQLQGLVDDFSQKSRKQTNLIRQKLNDVIATELANKGYQPLQDQEATQVGDVMLVAKYLAYKSINYSWAITNTFTFPTAHFRDINKIVDPTPGDGQFDYGVASIFELPLNGRFSLINQTGLVIQFADTRATRIPFSEDNRLSADVDPGAKRDLGDQFYTSFASLYNATPIFSFGGSYTIAYKQRDSWQGNLASPDRYRALGVETEQFLQGIYAQVTATTVNLFRKNKFPIPMMATLGVGQVVDGRNVRNDPLWSMNMSVFF